MKIEAGKRGVSRGKGGWGLMCILGALSGFINGLVGAGGGIVLVKLLPRLMPDGATDSRDVFATALATMLPISFVSLFVYALGGNLIELDIKSILLPAVLGGLGGGLLLSVIDTGLLKLIFSALVVWSGINMIF